MEKDIYFTFCLSTKSQATYIYIYVYIYDISDSGPAKYAERLNMIGDYPPIIWTTIRVVALTLALWPVP